MTTKSFPNAQASDRGLLYYPFIDRYYLAAQTMRVTRKGQVTIPKPMRDHLGIGPGTCVEFELAQDGRAYLRRVGKGKTKPSRFARMRGTATGGLTTDQIMRLTRDAAQ